MRIESLLGTAVLVIHPDLLERQLRTEVDPTTAAQITALAYGFDKTLMSNPVISSLVGDQFAPAIAALYGCMLRLLDDVIANPTGVSSEDLSRAQVTRAQIDQIVRLAQTADPRERESNNAEQSLDDILSDLMTDEGAPEPVR